MKPSIDQWMQEAINDHNSSKCGMYLTHVGVVRETAKALVRENKTDTNEVIGMFFSFDRVLLKEVIDETKKLNGIYYVKVWLNEG